eukprot:3823355-Pyramimonas_sp.AAC.1
MPCLSAPAHSHRRNAHFVGERPFDARVSQTVDCFAFGASLVRCRGASQIRVVASRGHGAAASNVEHGMSQKSGVQQR